MKEQSHKREMAAALRGDFERLRERGVPATIRVDEVEPVAVPEEDAVAAPAPAAPQRVRRSVLDRLLRRT